MPTSQCWSFQAICFMSLKCLQEKTLSRAECRFSVLRDRSGIAGRLSEFNDMINSSQHWHATDVKQVNRHFHQPSKLNLQPWVCWRISMTHQKHVCTHTGKASRSGVRTHWHHINHPSPLVCGTCSHFNITSLCTAWFGLLGCFIQHHVANNPQLQPKQWSLVDRLILCFVICAEVSPLLRLLCTDFVCALFRSWEPMLATSRWFEFEQPVSIRDSGTTMRLWSMQRAFFWPAEHCFFLDGDNNFCICACMSQHCHGRSGCSLAATNPIQSNPHLLLWH